jgi:hypothetical protein
MTGTSGARMLALGGTTASLLSMVGGLLDVPVLVGIGGAIMFAANVIVLFRQERM